ncbi:MAG: hypothetical protein WA432_00395 [Candidatus Babeliaceae bacterium]
MYISMEKVQEKDNFVFYKFFINVPGEEFINKYGRPDQKMKSIYGYCSFNKNTEEFILDTEKSDPYFTERSREVMACYGKLIKRKRDNEGFPPVITIATG